MTRAQLLLRAVVLLGPVVAVLATGPAGDWVPWWVLGGVLATSGLAARDPDGPFGACAGLVVLAWWAVAVGDRVSAFVLVAAVAMVAAHVAGVLASYGPATMPVGAATVRLWVRRAALVLLSVPATWELARLLRGQPEQPGIWLLGVAAACVATVIATATLAVRDREG